MSNKGFCYVWLHGFTVTPGAMWRNFYEVAGVDR